MISFVCLIVSGRSGIVNRWMTGGGTNDWAAFSPFARSIHFLYLVRLLRKRNLPPTEILENANRVQRLSRFLMMLPWMAWLQGVRLTNFTDVMWWLTMPVMFFSFEYGIERDFSWLVPGSCPLTCSPVDIKDEISMGALVQVLDYFPNSWKVQGWAWIASHTRLEAKCFKYLITACFHISKNVDMKTNNRKVRLRQLL